MSTFLHGGSGDEHIVLFSCKKKPIKINAYLNYNRNNTTDPSQNHMKLRERPLNLKGFFLKNILIPNVAEKNILILVEEKKNNLIQSLARVTNI
jgi:hypothetical protein